jgi:hypothetical protein
LWSGTSTDPYKAAGFTQSFVELAKTVPASKPISMNATEYKIDLESLMNSSNPGSYYASPLDTAVPVPVTCMASSPVPSTGAAYSTAGVVTAAAAFQYQVNSQVIITAQSAGSLVPFQVYFITAVASTTSFTISATPGGPAVTPAVAGTAVSFLVRNLSSLGSTCGKFAAGLDTRLSKKQTVSGIDTNGLLVSVNAQFDRDQIANMAQATLDLWAEFDAFVQVIPGVATTVTF